MNMEQRREKMVELVNREGSVSFAQLKQFFRPVSDMTVRRDLEYLDKQKRIIRTHGGARSVEVLAGTDDLYLRRSTRNAEGKRVIARKAVQLLQYNTAIFLDSGSTCTEFARLISDGPYMIFTTSVNSALELSRLSQAQVYVIGGRLNAASFCVNGAATLQQLETINFQTVFLGTMGYSQGRGFTCGSEEDCAVKRAAIRQSEKVVMLMDTQKVEVTGTFTFADTADINVLVTDSLLPERTARFFERNNVEVV